MKILPLNGKNSLLRIIRCYSAVFDLHYPVKYKVLSYPKLAGVLKQLIANYTEMQIGAMIILHFNWKGDGGKDEKTYSFLQDRFFPIEMIPRNANAYANHLQQVLGVSFEDEKSVENFVLDFFKKYGIPIINVDN